MAELPDPKSLLLEKLAVPCIDVDEIPDLVVELAMSKRLSIVVRNLNRLLRDPTDQELVGALCVTLTFSTTEQALYRRQLSEVAA
jgi:hypothetical protein